MEGTEVVVQGLTFEEFSRKNRERMRAWHEGDTADWTGADWSNAMCGEAGEAANVVKKLRRIETGTVGSSDPDRETLVSMLADELHDIIAYADLLADHYGIDFTAAQITKFNRVSRREGFPQLLGEEPEIDTRPWTKGGPPRNLLQAVRSVMQPNGGMHAPTRSWTPAEVLEVIRGRWPGQFPLCSVIDVADEMRRFYG